MTVNELTPPPGYAHTAIVEAGERLVFLAGAVPLDPHGNLVGEGDPTAQTHQVLRNLTTALHAAGTGLPHVIATTVYVATTDHADLRAVWDVVHASGLTTGPHTSTLLGVTVLGYAGQIVEITATAVIPSTP
ncbi:RidA family protein [Sphaerisporangium rubeum]|uniref:Enamine deaminase RidA (YjgF/YER057c/UK114 family) n=1 Tax=Sphaerisporangium rubeum TaxID=321317 RepID=A0A7X0M6L3_9ACTN|nr:RidA family protein [Sphaerisporangium rubeum]MBB6473838.1 enamine deaminase RidA (YjgF/YER057c/UK114 family) [Sphaerisporangium rubeum]